jgi:hypothetical protein
MPPGPGVRQQVGPVRSGAVSPALRGVVRWRGAAAPTAVGVGEQVQPGGPKGARVSGRPPFGLGPIARVASSATPAPSGQSLPEHLVSAANRPPERRLGIPIGGPPRYDPARTRAFGLPNLRRNVCPHFYVTGARGALPIHAPHLLKGIVRQDSVVSRCQLRGGVHLEQSYVNDVCLSPRFNQCVFYEEELSGR